MKYVKEAISPIQIKNKIPNKKYLEHGDYPVIDQGQLFIGGYTNDKTGLITQLPVIVFGDHTRVFKYVDFPFVAGADGVKIFQAKSCFLPKLLFYFLQAITLPDRGYARHYQYLVKSKIPVPPLAEQKRIVKKIEELFGVIDEQVKRLEAAQDALISYRQSILQQIFSSLPQKTTLRSIFKTSSGGTPSRRHVEYYEGNIPWVKSGELNYNTIIDTEEHLSQTALDNSSAKLFPKGSLLIALYGATIGRLAFLGVPAATNQAVCCIFPNEQYDMQFLYYFLQHKQKYLIFQSKGGAQKNISQEILKELPIPTIDLPEQKAIVKKIETAFAFANNAQVAITDALEQAKQLKQSILKRAFEGKLVPQDPNDKPIDLTQLKKDKQK